MDKAIINYFIKNTFILPNKSLTYTYITNDDAKSKINELYDQSKQCLDAFSIFTKENKLSLISQQKYVKNKDIGIHGYIDAIITLNDSKVIIDWKSKKEFKAYDEENAKIEYEKYIEKMEKLNYNHKSLDEYKKLYQKFSLSHLRYCLQVTLYWILLDRPKDFILMLGYFDSKKNYFLYSFNKENANKICETMIKYKNSSILKYKNPIYKKLQELNWMKFLEFKLVKTNKQELF